MNSISWNGLSLELNPHWEGRVQGSKHLIFESDLQPLFEIRWYPLAQKPNFQKECSKNGLNIKPAKTPKVLAQLMDDIFCYRQKNDHDFSGCFIYQKEQKYLIHCHLTTNETSKIQAIINHLPSLHLFADNIWKIQDFTINIPRHWKLDNFNFSPGLTRLQFSKAKTIMHICRLTEAQKRLTNISPEDLLRELAGWQDMQIHYNDSLYAYNKPSILKQLVIRAKRKKPFVEAQLKLTANDMILAMVIEDLRPINQEESKNIWQSYAIS
ncbi:MAG: hypothetical protein OCC45_12760 [Desulfotalea sp.]